MNKQIGNLTLQPVSAHACQSLRKHVLGHLTIEKLLYTIDFFTFPGHSVVSVYTCYYVIVVITVVSRAGDCYCLDENEESATMTLVIVMAELRHVDLRASRKHYQFARECGRYQGSGGVA